MTHHSKSSLVLRFIQGSFTEEYGITIPISEVYHIDPSLEDCFHKMIRYPSANGKSYFDALLDST